MARELPTSEPNLDVIALTPNEPVRAETLRDLVLLEHWQYSQAGSRIAGKAYDPPRGFTSLSYELLDTYILTPLKRQGGATTYYFLCQLNGRNCDLRFEFREPDNTLIGAATIVRPNANGPGQSEVEVGFGTVQDSIRCLVFGRSDNLAFTSQIGQYLVNSAPLDTGRSW